VVSNRELLTLEFVRKWKILRIGERKRGNREREKGLVVVVHTRLELPELDQY